MLEWNKVFYTLKSSIKDKEIDSSNVLNLNLERLVKDDIISDVEVRIEYKKIKQYCKDCRYYLKDKQYCSKLLLETRENLSCQKLFNTVQTSKKII